LPQLQRDYARCDVGEKITSQNGGLWPSRAPTADDWRGRTPCEMVRQVVTHHVTSPTPIAALQKV
jgi:hypothetical protein